MAHNTQPTKQHTHVRVDQRTATDVGSALSSGRRGVDTRWHPLAALRRQDSGTKRQTRERTAVLTDVPV
ncbi:cytochrome B [Anopheles sinensis]|uniref:Cytochrome B n=1 Tax=Anopheles sinensis TaxID=74873 RepID=A0A084VPZ1_ANOSI|nr:cytochrome B [Anopheles sinensis]